MLSYLCCDGRLPNAVAKSPTTSRIGVLMSEGGDKWR